MGSLALELLLCVLAFGFGYAANQGGTCLVVAAHELHRRQPPKMFVGFLAASTAAGLVAVPIVWTGTLGATLAPSTSINFLLLIGVALVADGLHFHIPRGYLYAAMAFSAIVELLNVVAKRNRAKPHG